MRRMSRRVARDQLTKRNDNNLPDGIGGTVTGGPMEPLDLAEILAQSAHEVTRGGAVSGAAHVVVSSVRGADGRDGGIALSDGSRIRFASVADAGFLQYDNVSAT
jgi:hypothetical protein